jgi:RHS repeat-associated protein
VQARFTPGANPAPPSKQGTAFFVHENHLGSAGVVTTEAGDVNDAHEYFPDGATWIESGKGGTVDGFLFEGKPLDPDTGCYDFGQRFYDPRTSLWLGIDADFKDSPGSLIGKRTALALSAFAAHNPLRFIDPDGRGWLDWVGRQVAAASKVIAGAGAFAVGATLCSTGVGCLAGGPLMVAAADVAGSGTMELITDKPHPTVVGQYLGPTAQQWEEAAVFGADLAGVAAKAKLPKPPHASPPKKPPTPVLRVLRRLVVGGGRAEKFPPLDVGDVAMNVDAAAKPDILGDINNAQLADATFDAIHFENVPFITDRLALAGRPGAGITVSLKEAARILKPGGTLTIETGNLMMKGGSIVNGQVVPLIEELAPQLRQALENLRFKIIDMKVVGEGPTGRIIVKAQLPN